jgi:DNA-binding IclR family transcriptional regulator
LFIDGVESRQPVRVATRTGARLPPYATAGGKVLLAYLPAAIVRSRYPEALRRITRFTIPDIDALEQELQLVRKHGYAVNLGEHLTDVHAIGVPIAVGTKRPVAALTLAGPSTRWSRRRLELLAPKLASSASAIARQLADTNGASLRP